MSKEKDIKDKLNKLRGKGARKGLMAETEEDQTEETPAGEEAAAALDPHSNINNNNNENEDDNMSFEAVINQNRGTKSTTQLVGIYFEPDVKDALAQYQKDMGKGAKSSLINDLAKLAMKQKGYL